MSEPESQDDLRIKTEIQELLGEINDDMLKLKMELKSMNDLIEENASLPLTMKMVNEKLVLTATAAGIDIENLNDIESLNDLEGNDHGSPDNETTQSNDGSAVTSDGDRSAVASDAGALSAATDKLTKKIRNALK